MYRTQIFYYILLLFLVGCSNNKQNESESKLYANEGLLEEINNYLIKNEGISGYGGEVFCDHKLIGRKENKYYIIFYCQEYYLLDTTEILKGTGLKSPAVILYKDNEIKGLGKPRDGAAFSVDIDSLFPSEFIKDLKDEFSSNQWVDSGKVNLFKRNLREKRIENISLFNSIQNGDMKAKFYGAGTEPFWSMYLIDEEFLLINSGIINRYEVLNDFDVNAVRQIIIYKNSAQDTLKVELVKENTFEELSNKSYPYRVIIHLDSNYALKGVGDTKKL